MSDAVRVRTANLLGALALDAAQAEEAAAAEVVGQSGAAAAALVLIAASPGRSVEQLRGGLRLSQPGAARLFDRLAREGWIDSGATPGRRGFAVTLTAAGERKLEEVLHARRNALLEVLAGLDDEEVGEFATFLERMLAARTTGQAGLERLCRMCERAVCSHCPVGHAVDEMTT